jgi:hypothetical protein
LGSALSGHTAARRVGVRIGEVRVGVIESWLLLDDGIVPGFVLDRNAITIRLGVCRVRDRLGHGLGTQGRLRVTGGGLLSRLGSIGRRRVSLWRRSWHRIGLRIPRKLGHAEL